MSDVRRIERRVSLRDLRVLVSVIESGSMGKAARLLATSQPAISRSIADLEHAFGVRLLERSAYGVEPTRYGSALLKRGIAIPDRLCAMHDRRMTLTSATKLTRSSIIKGR